MTPDAQVLRPLSEQLRTLVEVLRILEERGHLEELVLRTLKILAVRAQLGNLAVRAQLRNLAVRALLVKHLAFERAC